MVEIDFRKAVKEDFGRLNELFEEKSKAEAALETLYEEWAELAE